MIKEDWVECTLGELLRVSSGKGLTSKRMDGGIYPVYGGNGITGYHSQKIFDEQKLIIGRVGVRCGVTHITQKNSWVTDNALVVNFKSNDFDLKFMKLKLQFENLNKLSNSTAQPVISGTKIYSYPIILPPLVEQKALVTKIEELFSSLHSGINDLQKAQAQLKIYRQAVLKKAFEGELTKKWREQQSDLLSGDELLEQIKEGREKYYEQQLERWKKAVKVWEENGKEGKKRKKPKTFKEMQSLSKDDLEKLPIIPDEWKWSTISNLAKEMCLGKMLDKKKNEGNLKPYLGNINVRWGAFDLENVKQMRFLESENERYSLQKGDLIICEGGEPGRCAVWKTDRDMKIQKALHRVRFFQFCTDSTFVFYFMNYSASIGSLSKYFTGTTIKHLTGQGLSKVTIPLQSLQEQHQIVQQIESRLSVCDKVEESISVSLKKAEALRQSILKKAFEGKLLSPAEVEQCKEAADYEPASVLLEKIKSGKYSE